jgi:hypothetical protein
MNISGVDPLRKPYVYLRLGGKRSNLNNGDLDIGHCMGSPCVVSCWMDCCKALPRTATNVDRMDQQLLRGIIKNSPALLCKVGS